MSKLQELAEQGQSIWLDYISRSLIASGELRNLVEDGLRGVTSNPTIFEKAITQSEDYDDTLQQLARAGKSTDEIYESLTFADIQDAADVLRTVYERTEGIDGYVSLEVDPGLAHNTEETVSEAKRLTTSLNRSNLMIKVPATAEGIPAIRTLIGAGINVNVTLMFSLAHYEAVSKAYIAGLEDLQRSGGDLGEVASVASFFVSRVDSAVDPMLEEQGAGFLLGRIAVANAKACYARFREIFGGTRWDRLAQQGARVQRPLWASTSTKNPNYPDTVYVDSLIGPHTVNTVPPKTLRAFRDHGTIGATVEADLKGARAELKQLGEAGIDFTQVATKLQEDGVNAFAKSFASLLDSIDKKRRQALGTP